MGQAPPTAPNSVPPNLGATLVVLGVLVLLVLLLLFITGVLRLPAPAPLDLTPTPGLTPNPASGPGLPALYAPM